MSDALSSSPYQRLGGEAGLRRLVDRFYGAMDSLPAAAGIRAMHGDLGRANEKLYKFLSGWLGGPNLFWEAYGHPMLRARHLPFVIGPSERDQWMGCMRVALLETVADIELREVLEEALAQTAQHMINQPHEGHLGERGGVDQ